MGGGRGQSCIIPWCAHALPLDDYKQPVTGQGASITTTVCVCSVLIPEDHGDEGEGLPFRGLVHDLSPVPYPKGALGVAWQAVVQPELLHSLIQVTIA